ncbi:MAG: aminotransferase class III-fold pyridoxal phosphate-dependent enzyme [Actinobacteria bacterium]|nr:aminotransferase class III-fold pyridoxal phosphate-dependent enzyme [Actinomycetota bacterium]
MQAYGDRERLDNLFREELNRYISTHPRSRELYEEASEPLLSGVPMIWMSKWPGPYPLYVEHAKGAHFTDVDGLMYTDFCLGDTGAMSGHAPDPTVKAVQQQIARGSTFMLPTEDAAHNGVILSERFGLTKWQFTLSATDANRHMLRYSRHVTGRQKIAVHDYCYHGTVDETFAVMDDEGNTIPRRDNVGKPIDLKQTTVVVPFNDLEAAERAFATGEVAAMLMEPALTNIGIVLPEPDYLKGMEELCLKYDVIWILDETHTLSAGPGGMTAKYGLNPDAVVLGKTIGGGVPVGAYGLTNELALRIESSMHLESIDIGGVGGTLAGNALSMAAVRATLENVLTPKAFERMDALAELWVKNVQEVIDDFQLPWQVSRIGCRGEYSFRPTAPKNGREAADADDFELQQYLQLHAINRGILMTPFHNMALMSPFTDEEDVAHHHAHFREAVSALYS